jgi:tape measure domain-containing protein
MASISSSIELYDKVSAPINNMLSAINNLIDGFEAIERSIEMGFDTSSIGDARQAISQATAQMGELQSAIQEVNSTPLSPSPQIPNIEPITVPVEMDVPDTIPVSDPIQVPVEMDVPDTIPVSLEPQMSEIRPVRIPVYWDSDGFEVFTNTGVERFEQELSSANRMMDSLIQKQQRISQNANEMAILPNEALSDLSNMTQRIQQIQQKIQQLNNLPVYLKTDKVNNELEYLRSQLSQATEAQNELNYAVNYMQVGKANDAYAQLSKTIADTEKYIRDNTTEQGLFNQSIDQGVNQANDLMDSIKGIISAYVGFQSVKKVMDISDELTQTTARINMMNDGLQTTPELMNMIYQSAQDARGSFTDMAAVVAKFGNNAGDAFGSSEEVVAFANLVQKQMTIAGASTAEASNAMLQLSQALGSGVLRGDELNSIFEQAPNLIQSIADYLDVPIGQIRTMAQEGQLSADIVKNAIFAASDEINAQFEQIPMTWNQVWTTMKNGALMHFQPVLDKVNELANNQDFQTFASSAVEALATVSVCLLGIFDLVGAVGNFFSENWSVISPIIMGIVTALGLYYGAMLAYNTITGISTAITAAKAFAETVHAASLAMQTGATFAATAAQYGFNAALLACPLTWIILIIIAVIAAIYAVIGAINKIQGTTISATGVIVGALTSAVAFIWNLFLGLVDFILGCVNYLVNPWIAFANFFGNLFNDPIGSIVHLFGDMADNILGILENIAKAIDKVFGSNLASSVQGWRSGLDTKIEAVANKYGNGGYEKVVNKLNLSSESLGLKRWAYTDAFDLGYSWGTSAENSISDVIGGIFGSTGETDPNSIFEGEGYEGYDAGQIPSNIADIANNTGAMKDSLDITSEDLKYLRDIAEKEAVNKFTTAEIRVEMTNHNNISSDFDLDGVVDYLANGVSEAMEKAAEGVHA